MNLTPKTDKEIEEMNLIPNGFYQFEVMSAEETKSVSGNEMIKLQLKIWDANGRERIVFDWILEAFAKKLKSFCKATGLIEKYDLGVLPASDCVGKYGKLELIVKKGGKNPKGGMYSDSNSVKDYFHSDHETPKKDEFVDDAIPF